MRLSRIRLLIITFYGDEKTALYKAHPHKNKEGIDDNGILKLLPEETTVMHDHNKVNYNREYSFSNIECNVHLLRDLQKTTDNLQHQWSEELKNLLEKTNVQEGGTYLDLIYTNLGTFPKSALIYPLMGQYFRY
ncbi:transposase [Clostridium sp. WLY-B-L2]|uniref:Transposase n=1 Tax=Clostridium aromativorans TaxID=2836848 RepID=A0ABS8N499_9CLOT|nr:MULTISPECIES: transposase [Clostridium]MCC9293915.1 transposase [Clostridium aromativorans]